MLISENHLMNLVREFVAVVVGCSAKSLFAGLSKVVKRLLGLVVRSVVVGIGFVVYSILYAVCVLAALHDLLKIDPFLEVVFPGSLGDKNPWSTAQQSVVNV